MNRRLQVLRTLRRGWRTLRGRRSELALGIERIGLLSLRFPALVACGAVVLTVSAGHSTHPHW
jgi:uncharacterized protein